LDKNPKLKVYKDPITGDVIFENNGKIPQAIRSGNSGIQYLIKPGETVIGEKILRNEKDYPDMLDKGKKPIFKLDNKKKKLPPGMNEKNPYDGGIWG
jgi:hypothetical protein